MVNARCAQEAASAVGVHGRNKEAKAPSRGPSIGGLSAARPGPRMGLAAATEPTGTPRPSAGLSPAEDVSEPAPTKKKKDNTMLLVGAAVLGIVILSKK